MSQEISSKYAPGDIETKWYAYWQQHRFFESVPDDREPYTVVIPPPNVTGVLHMGHMLNNSLQDTLVRRARMLGKNALWVPGTDHASIATEAKVVAMLKEQGVKKTDLTRDEFLKHAWAWKEKYGGIILKQLEKLGASCDWTRTRFTMEPKLSEAVIDVFIDLFNKGYIYRGVRMVNWDPAGKTALSDEEVVYKEVQSKLYYIKYPVAGSNAFVTIATTRPETLLGDTAVCCHPDDPRYFHLKGKEVIVPIVNRQVPVIFDTYIDPEFGTGTLKVTPAHDINDYNLGQRFGLESIDVLADDGTIAPVAGHYVGLDRFVVRKKIVQDLEALGLVEKIEDIRNSVGHSERTDAVIEPKLSTQWFVDMKKFMADYPQVLEAVMSDEISFHPPKFKNTYKYWMDNIKDWCISRQLWWGQRIPAWYNAKGEWVVSKTEDEARKLFAEKGQVADGLRQDEDVLDTWFSSWLWPISVFDGFEDSANRDIAYYYPTNDLVTAPEILFFWVARMIMAGYAWRGEKPFKNVYLTGIVRDKQRRKMSKSLGNSPDPLELIAQYGADGVRMGMMLCSTAGNDILFDESQVEQGRNFCNKIWNAFRLVKGWERSNQPASEGDKAAIAWFRGRFNTQLLSINEHFDQFRISDALMEIYKLVWDDFCSWYLEMVKPPFGEPAPAETVNATVAFFDGLLRLMQPFMPFITEELWQQIMDRKQGESICVATWPEPFAGETLDASRSLEIITLIRGYRNQHGISPKEPLEIGLFSSTGKKAYASTATLIEKLANVNPIQWLTEKPTGKTAFMAGTDEVFVLTEREVDAAAERAKIEEEINYLQGFMRSVDAKLNNERFVSHANPDVVHKERQKKADAVTKLEALQARLAGLS